MTPQYGLSGVFFQIDFVHLSDDFLIVVVTAGTANMVRPFQFTAIRAFIGVCRNKRIMRAAIVAAGFRYFVLLDSHVSTFSFNQHGAYPRKE